MQRRAFILSLGAPVLAFGLPAFAEAQRLTAEEIETLLSGKRIRGDWNGTAYGQVFWTTGTTLYTPEGGATDAGKWRVNAAEDTYESWWENSGWSSYAIARDGDALFWIDAAGERHPFEVLPGE